MVALSKLTEWPLNSLHCSQHIIHPNKTCLQFLLQNVFCNLISAGKYFLPLVIMPVLLKGKKPNAPRMWNSLRKFLQAVIYGTLSNALIFFAVCALRCSLGKFHMYSLCFLPALMSMLTICWFYPKDILYLFVTATSQSSFEAVLRTWSNAVTRFVLTSRPFQAAVFMVNSAAILHFKRAKIYNGFWFVEPLASPAARDPPTAEGSNTKRRPLCTHENQTCTRYILQGMKTYLLYGIPLDLLSLIMKWKSKVKRLPTGMAKLKLLRFQMTAFFLSYVGVYRLSSCLMLKYFNGKSDDFRHFIAACCGSFTAFMCLSKINFFTFSTIIVVQILWQQFCKQPKSEQTKFTTGLELLKRFPFGRIVNALNMAFFIHSFMFQHHVVNSLGRGFINAISNRRTQMIYDIVSSNDVEALMQAAKQNIYRGFC